MANFRDITLGLDSRSEADAYSVPVAGLVGLEEGGAPANPRFAAIRAAHAAPVAAAAKASNVVSASFTDNSYKDQALSQYNQAALGKDVYGSNQMQHLLNHALGQTPSIEGPGL